jgi:hypothetical protein
LIPEQAIDSGPALVSVGCNEVFTLRERARRRLDTHSVYRPDRKEWVQVHGIQYQQGLKDMVPASDLVEGLLNNVDRPVFAEGTGKELFTGDAVVHFNEVDDCAGVDALVTNHCWKALGLDPSTTLHDVRWGEHYKEGELDDSIWLFQIPGAAPASHFLGGYEGASSERQPAMYFPLGGGSLKGIRKPGEIVWSRVFVEGGALHVDLGRATVVSLPAAETRWRETSYQWPIMHARLHGVTRDQFMGEPLECCLCAIR